MTNKANNADHLLTSKNALALVAAVAVAGCEPQPEQLAYWQHPEDPRTKAQAMERCLERAQGPKAVHYNDLDEAIEACESYASDMARYCPDKARTCLPQYQRTQADVQRAFGEP